MAEDRQESAARVFEKVRALSIVALSAVGIAGSGHHSIVITVVVSVGTVLIVPIIGIEIRSRHPCPASPFVFMAAPVAVIAVATSIIAVPMMPATVVAAAISISAAVLAQARGTRVSRTVAVSISISRRINFSSRTPFGIRSIRVVIRASV